MVRIESFEVTMSREEGIYFAGEVLDGQLIISNKDTIAIEQLYMHIKGEGSTSWLNKTSEQAFTFNQVYIDRVLDIPVGEDGKDSHIPPGNHFLPFQIPLPPELPSSVEGEWGYIRYKLRAVLEVAGHRNIVCSVFGLSPQSNSISATVDFQLVSVLDLRVNPLHSRPVETEDLLYFYSCCIRTGHIKAALRLHKLGFALNEPIVISAEVANRSRRQITSVNAKIVQHMRFYGQSEFLQSDELKEANVLVGAKDWGSIPPRTRQIFELEVVPLHDESKILPTQVNFAVNIEYSLIFEIEPSGLQLEVPLILGSFPSKL